MFLIIFQTEIAPLSLSKKCSLSHNILPPLSTFIIEFGVYHDMYILGGDIVTPSNSQPWMAALVYDKKGSLIDRQFCGGALIDDRHIVTAAHCMPK